MLSTRPTHHTPNVYDDIPMMTARHRQLLRNASLAIPALTNQGYCSHPHPPDRFVLLRYGFHLCLSHTCSKGENG